MNKGVVLVAHNSSTTNYFDFACFTAKRVNEFLNLPVTLITDSNSVIETNNIFDKIIYTDVDNSNYKNKNIWINKGRYKVFDLSPYDESIVLDVDYVINSNKLKDLFLFENDFMCFKNTFFLMDTSTEQEMLSKKTVQTVWATVMKFKKTKRAEQIFQMIEMVQNNYDHYSKIYDFLTLPYRNDYALTIALKTVNGHFENLQDYIPWSLVHVDEKISIEKISNTGYKLFKNLNGKNWYIETIDKDFHMLNKTEFKKIIS